MVVSIVWSLARVTFMFSDGTEFSTHLKIRLRSELTHTITKNAYKHEKNKII